MARRIVMIGCVEAGYFVGRKLVQAGIKPAAIVSVASESARKNQVSGYKCLFDLDNEAIHYEPERYDLGSDADFSFFSKYKFDIMLVLGWQRLIPVGIINTLSICGLTIHGSADGLPKGRGRSPMNWALIEGRDCFKLSLLTLAAGADSGRIIDTIKFDILPTDTIKTLYYKNALAAARMIITNLPSLTQSSGIEQDESKATCYPKRSPEDGKIVWSASATDIERLVKAVTHPYPGAFTYVNGDKMMIWQGQMFDRQLSSGKNPGEVVAVFPDNSFLVATGEYDFLVLNYAGTCPDEGCILT